MDINLNDTATHGPLYAQIRSYLADAIRSGSIASGSTLIGPAALAQQLKVDRGEVLRAYSELEQGGLVRVSQSRNFLGERMTTYTVR